MESEALFKRQIFVGEQAGSEPSTKIGKLHNVRQSSHFVLGPQFKATRNKYGFLEKNIGQGNSEGESGFLK